MLILFQVCPRTKETANTASKQERFETFIFGIFKLPDASELVLMPVCSISYWGFFWLAENVIKSADPNYINSHLFLLHFYLLSEKVTMVIQKKIIAAHD